MGNKAFFEFVGFVACENGIAICRPEIETQGEVEVEEDDEVEGVAQLLSVLPTFYKQLFLSPKNTNQNGKHMKAEQNN